MNQNDLKIKKIKIISTQIHVCATTLSYSLGFQHDQFAGCNQNIRVSKFTTKRLSFIMVAKRIWNQRVSTVKIFNVNIFKKLLNLNLFYHKKSINFFVKLSQKNSSFNCLTRASFLAKLVFVAHWNQLAVSTNYYLILKHLSSLAVKRHGYRKFPLLKKNFIEKYVNNPHNPLHWNPKFL